MILKHRAALVAVAITLCCALITLAAGQTRSEFFSRDLSFSFQDSDRFAAVNDPSALLHLVGPGGLQFVVSKKPSQARSLTELSETFPQSLSAPRRVLSNQMSTVGAQLATVFEIATTAEKPEELAALVLHDRQAYSFWLKLPDDDSWSADRALALLDQIVWKVPERPAGPSLEFRASDKSFILTTEEDFRVTYNPHAVLSLANLDDVAIVVTKAEAKHTLDQLYDGIPRSLPAGTLCHGRMMLNLGTEQAAAFVLEGMFPPQGPPTHQTLLAVVVREGNEYNFMVHYPVENARGLEDAHAVLSTVEWSAQAE